MRKLFLTGVLAFASLATMAQEQSADTVKVSLAKTSQIIFTIKDHNDLQTLKHYNFAKLFEDIISKLEKSDTAITIKSDTVSTEIAKSETENKRDSVCYNKHKRLWQARSGRSSINF